MDTFIKFLNDNPGLISLFSIITTISIAVLSLIFTTLRIKRNHRPRIRVNMATLGINKNNSSVSFSIINSGTSTAAIANVSLNNHAIGILPGNLIIVPKANAELQNLKFQEYYDELYKAREIFVVIEYIDPEDRGHAFSITQKYRWSKENDFFNDLGTVSET